MLPKLSIITICYNEVARIEATIQSVLQQTFTDYEYIVIDGASTDGTVDILKSYQEYFNVFISESDKGIYNAMNKAIDHCKGEYVLFLNGGDYLANNEVLKNVFSYNFKEDIAYGYLATKEGKVIKNLKGVDLGHFIKTKTLPHQASFIKKSLLIKINGFDESFKIAGDYDFFMKAIIKHKVSTRYIPTLVAIFDMNGISNQLPEIVEKEKSRVQELLNKKNDFKTYLKSKLFRVK